MVKPAQRTSPLLQPSVGGWEVRDTERRAITYESLVITEQKEPTVIQQDSPGPFWQPFLSTDPLPHGLLLDASRMKS